MKTIITVLLWLQLFGIIWAFTYVARDLTSNANDAFTIAIGASFIIVIIITIALWTMP